MKTRRIIHRVLLVMGLSVIGLLFYYTMWIITDEELRSDIVNGFPWGSWGMLVDYIACCLFTTVVTLYYWHSQERAEWERDCFRMQALENQLSPHFVFNNFSILADLIETEPKRASEFLMNLSRVYRYTLSHLNSPLVSIQEELEFIDRYLSLLRQRFGNGIQVLIFPEVSCAKGSLPPATIQMLIENAIKHNVHTQSHPLIIRVTCHDGHISVCNNKCPMPDVESTNVGHHNIVERYRLLTSKSVTVDDRPDEYCVTIPLITD